MIYPAPTTSIDPSLARAVLEEQRAEPPMLVLSFANTSYRMHLVPAGPIRAEVGKRILGVIRARARRVDVVDTGGRYAEPVFGRPRRVQGTIVALRPADNAIVVNAGMPIHCQLTDARQSPADFTLGDLVSFDVLDGATFTQSA
jgi:hypothetical protein